MAAHTSPLVVEHRQPGAHAIRGGQDIIGVDLVIFQLAHHAGPQAGVVHQAHKGGTQLHVGDVLHHVAADAAGDLLHPAHIAPAGDIGGRGISLDVHENGAQHHNTHKNALL